MILLSPGLFEKENGHTVIRGYVKLHLIGDGEDLVKPVISPRRLIAKFEAQSKPIITLSLHGFPIAPSSGLSSLLEAHKTLTSHEEVLQELVSRVVPSPASQPERNRPGSDVRKGTDLAALVEANRDLARAKVILLDAALPPHLSFFIKDFVEGSDHECFPTALLDTDRELLDSIHSLSPNADMGTTMDLFRRVSDAIARTSQEAFQKAGYSARSSARDYAALEDLLPLPHQLNVIDLFSIGEITARRFSGLLDETEEGPSGSLPLMLPNPRLSSFRVYQLQQRQSHQRACLESCHVFLLRDQSWRILGLVRGGKCDREREWPDEAKALAPGPHVPC